MLASIFYGTASLVLCVMISNATGPVIDYSHLAKPTATVSSIPPVPVPAAVLSSLLSQERFDSLLAIAYSKLLDYKIERISSSISNNNKRRAVSLPSSYSFWSWSLSGKRRRKRRNPTTTSSSSSMGFSYDHEENEERPYRSRFSPPAAFSVEDYEQYKLRHVTSFNKSESGICGTDGIYSHHQEQQIQDDWKTRMPINIPIKP